MCFSIYYVSISISYVNPFIFFNTLQPIHREIELWIIPRDSKNTIFHITFFCFASSRELVNIYKFEFPPISAPSHFLGLFSSVEWELDRWCTESIQSLWKMKSTYKLSCKIQNFVGYEPHVSGKVIDSIFITLCPKFVFLPHLKLI